MADLGTGVTGYPGEIDTNDSPQTSDDYTDYLTLEGAIAAILAIETELGINPGQSVGTVLAYLQVEHDSVGSHTLTSHAVLADLEWSVAGHTIDAVLVMGDNNISFGTSTGGKLATATNQKLSFWNSTPVIQQSSVGETAGFTAGSGTAVKDDSTFTGNVGSIAYTVSDIVKHLKTIGILAS